MSKLIERFNDGCKYCKNNVRLGCSFTSYNKNIEFVRPRVFSDRRMSVQVIADESNIGKSSVHTILTVATEIVVCQKKK